VRAPFVAALATLGAVFWAGAFALRALLATPPRAIATDLAQPLAVVTAWGGYGERCFAILAVCVAVAAAALAAALRFAPATGLPRPGLIVAATAAAALLGAAAWPCTFSSDPYAYAAYGAEAARGLDPYRPLAATVRGASLDAARYQWGGTFPVCVYGPAFIAFAEWIWRWTARFGAAAPIAALRLTAGLAFLASIPVLDAALAGIAARRRLIIVCAYGLQPVALWSAAEGHNDTFVLLAAACAALLARRGYPFSAGTLLGLSTALKAPAAFLAAGAALDALALRRVPAAAYGVLGGLLLAALIVVPPLLPALTETGSRGHYAPQLSLQASLGLVPALALAALAGAGGLARILRRERDGFAWLGLAAVAALPNVYPWYALWLVPFALAALPSAPALGLYGVTICAVVRYLPDATGNMTDGAIRLATLATFAPLLALVPGIAVLARPKQVLS
jgi:hypothetical protein